MDTGTQTSLGSIVSRFRRTADDGSLSHGAVELEIRLDSVDFHVFETILDGLLDGKIQNDGGEIAHSVSSIMMDCQKHGDGGGTSQSVREAFIPSPGTRGERLARSCKTPGKKVERYYHKRSLINPYRVRSPHTMPYKVSLAIEEEIAPFASDGSALIRIKNRISFTGAPKDIAENWRIDMTITRQIYGTDAGSPNGPLKNIVDVMFGGKQSPRNLLEVLGLRGMQNVALQRVYNYEIEIEYIGKIENSSPSDVNAIIHGILKLSDPGYMQKALYQQQIHFVAGFLYDSPSIVLRYAQSLGLKQLTPQVRALTRGEYAEIYPPVGYWLTDKAHGVHALAIVRNGQLILLSDRLYEYYMPDMTKAMTDDATMVKTQERGPSDRAMVSNVSIADGELLITGERMEFFVYDVIANQGTHTAQEGFSIRLQQIGDIVKIIGSFGVMAQAKPYIQISSPELASLKSYFHDMSERKERPYSTDGLILVEPDKNYMDTRSYKWKPFADTTIDFLARRAPSSILGKKPFIDTLSAKVYLLFVGIAPEMKKKMRLQWCPGYSDLFPIDTSSADKGFQRGSYFPIQFQPSDSPFAYIYKHPTNSKFHDIDGSIIEMRCTDPPGGRNGGHPPNWEMVRKREDRVHDLKGQRYFGNDFRIAELTWLNYMVPFPFEQLYIGPEKGYFAHAKSGIYKSQTGFTSFVKSQIIAHLKHQFWVVDLGIGKGQDLGRYMEAHVKNLIGVDADPGALAELVRRKYSHAANPRLRKLPGMALHAIVGDLSQPALETAEKIRNIIGYPEEGCDTVVSNLMVHYLADSPEHIENLAVLCRHLVKPRGDIYFTTMCGDTVFKLLEDANIGPNQTWEVRQDGILKYAIQRQYSGNKMTAAGQKIGVLLPFSGGELYRENLVNVAGFVAAFTRRGFTLVETKPFAHWFSSFKIRNAGEDRNLTEGDRQWLSLYSMIRFRRAAREL